MVSLDDDEGEPPWPDEELLLSLLPATAEEELTEPLDSELLAD